MRELRIFGMRRSGNHAIIEWIARHFNRVIHYNECWGWDEISYRSKHFYGNKENDIDLTIYSYEDFYPSEQEIQDPRCVVVLRDWYNMMASRLTTDRLYVKHRHQPSFNNDKVLETWIEYAKLYEKYKDKFILYNKWVSDSSYRLLIERQLDLGNLNDKFIVKFPSSGVGGGSSFDQNKVNLKTINQRYKLLKIKSLELYEKIIVADVVECCKNIFGIEIKDSPSISE